MGAITISVDAELAWGYHDLADPPERLAAARAGWRTAMELFDVFDVPATWATVGHLFLESCEGIHPEIPLDSGWFGPDPGSSVLQDDAWYAADLVERLRDGPVDHEIACHSFSHVEMGAPSTTREVAEAELQACVDAAARWDVTLDSFVFPRNDVGHRSVLAEYGFTCYRGPKPDPWYGDSRLRALWKLASWTVGGAVPPLVRPTVDEYGLVDVPASLYLFSLEGVPRRVLAPVWPDPIVTLAKRGVDAACETDGGVLHLWFHPHNLLQPGGSSRLASILAYVAEKRSESAVTVETMAEVASRSREREERPPAPTVT